MLIKRSLWYKHAQLIPEGSARFNLEDFVRTRYGQTRGDWTQRKCSDRYDAQETHVCNEVLDTDDMFFGRLLAFRPGFAQEICRTNHNDPTIPVQLLQMTEEGEEITSGHVYFGIRGNHVLVLQSVSLKFKALEHFLNVWLSPGLNGAKLLVDDVMPESARLQLRRVKSISVGLPLTERSIAQPRRIQGDSGSLAAAASRFLRRGDDEKAIARVREKLGDRHILAELVLRAPGRKRRRRDDSAEVASDVLDELARFLVNSDHDYNISFGNRDRLSTEQVKIQKEVELNSIHGMPVLDQVAQHMSTWLDELQRQRRVRSGRG